MAQRYPPRKKKKSGGWTFFAILAVVFLLAHNFSGGKASPQPSAPPALSNDPRQLAAQVLQFPDDIHLTDATHAALDSYAKGGKLVNFCGAPLDEVDPLLLQNLLHLQQAGFQVLVNNFGIGNDRIRELCVGHDQHMLARAVDLNGIIKKGGPRTDWGDIEFRPGGEMQAIQEYADAWLDLLPRNRGSVGQQTCLNKYPNQPGGFKVVIPPGSLNIRDAAYGDACNHLHLDVRIR